MKLIKLYAENMYSYPELNLNFEEFSGTTTIILGKNLDQKSANGSGKSSILKILFWSLWNKELNGANIESMISRTQDNGMLSILEFTDRGHSFKITRYKDYKPHNKSPKLYEGKEISGSGVEFLVNGEPLHGETHVQTQKNIEQKIRMSPRLFLSSVLTAQNTPIHFLTANDTEKKELLSELLDLVAYIKAFDKIKETIKETEAKLSKFEFKLDNLINQIENNNKEIIKLSSDEKNFKAENDKTISSFKDELKSLKIQINQIKVLADQKDPSADNRDLLIKLEFDFNKLKEQIKIEPQVELMLNNIQNEIKNFNQQLESNSSLSINLDSKISDLKNNLNNIPSITFSEETVIELTNKVNEISLTIKKLEDSRNDILNKKITLESFSSKLKSLNENLTIFQKQLNKAVQDNSCPTCDRVFEDSSKGTKTINDLNEKITNTQSEISAIETEIASLTKETSKLKDINNEISSLIESKNFATENLLKYKENEKLLTLYKNQKEDLEKQIIKLEEEKTQFSLKNETIEKSIIDKEKKLKEIKLILEDLIPLKEQFVKSEQEILALKTKIQESEILSQKIINAKQTLNEKQDYYNKVEKQIEELSNKENPYSKVKKRISEQVESFTKDKSSIEKNIENIKEELHYLNFWKIGFAPTGIRSFITDDVISLLNKKTQENLNDLFDGAITVVFEPESVNAKGIKSNKIDTKFLLNGKETPFELLSGGEQQRAILATDLALTDVAEARAGTKLNIRFLDEPFNGIDDNGQLKCLTLFSRLSRDKDGFFIISHEEKFQNLCQLGIYVVKDKEKSKLVDKQTFQSIDFDSISKVKVKKANPMSNLFEDD